jgi:hypothetical protein
MLVSNIVIEIKILSIDQIVDHFVHHSVVFPPTVENLAINNFIKLIS